MQPGAAGEAKTVTYTADLVIAVDGSGSRARSILQQMVHSPLNLSLSLYCPEPARCLCQIAYGLPLAGHETVGAFVKCFFVGCSCLWLPRGRFVVLVWGLLYLLGAYLSSCRVGCTIQARTLERVSGAGQISQGQNGARSSEPPSIPDPCTPRPRLVPGPGDPLREALSRAP